jgi:hypothetical protein
LVKDDDDGGGGDGDYNYDNDDTTIVHWFLRYFLHFYISESEVCLILNTTLQSLSAFNKLNSSRKD